jgi:hypothetical protein
VLGCFIGRPLRVLHGTGKREVARRPWHSGTREGRRSVSSVKEKGRMGKGGTQPGGGLSLLGQIGLLGQMAAGPEERKGKIEIYFEVDF